MFQKKKLSNRAQIVLSKFWGDMSINQNEQAQQRCLILWNEMFKDIENGVTLNDFDAIVFSGLNTGDGINGKLVLFLENKRLAKYSLLSDDCTDIEKRWFS